MTTFDVPPDRSNETDQTFDRFCSIRDQVGLRAALGYLGAVTGFRRAAVITQADDGPSAVAYFDRERPDVLQPDQWPAAVAAACLVRTGGGPVREARELSAQTNTASEALATGCRCVPVIDADGELHASLCVFDTGDTGDAGPVEDKDIDLPLLLRVAASLAGEGVNLTPSAAWQAGSALDALSARGSHGSTPRSRPTFNAAAPPSSSLHES